MNSLLNNTKNNTEKNKIKAPLTALTVSEIFTSLQGEGPYMGYPCFFIRLSGCNLRCSYCDTSYAWEEGRGDRMNIHSIITMWQEADIGLVQITGGEPLLQKGVYRLMSILRQCGATVLLETNGTIGLSDIPKGIIRSVDWKCPDSGMEGHFCLDNLRLLDMNDVIKFVVSSKEDYLWAKEKVFYHSLHLFTNVLFTPAWERIDAVELSRWIIKDKLLVRLGIQLHKLLWGDKRGR